MKIAVVCNWYYPHAGGSSIVVHKICKELSKNHDVTVLTPIRTASPLEEIVDNVRIKRFRNRYNPDELLPYNESKSHCLGILKELILHKYDLIHGYPALSYDVLSGVVTKFLKRTPIFLTIFDLLDYRKFTLNKFPDTELLRRELGNMRSWRKWVLGKLNAIFSISYTELEFLQKINRKCFFTPIPVDLEEFDANLIKGIFRQKYNIGNRPLVLCVGRVERHKGQDILIRAASEVIKKASDVLFGFVGPIVDNNFYGEITNMVKDLKLSEHVFFTGEISREAVISAYSDCDLNVVPVRFLNSGAVVVETWAARKPVLQSNRVDPNHVEEGIDGFTFVLDNKADLVGKILVILSNENLRKRMGEQGRRKVETEFTYTQLIKQLESIYYKLM